MPSDDLKHFPARDPSGPPAPARQRQSIRDRALDDLLRELAPLPKIRWEALARRISDAIPRSPPHRRRSRGEP